MFKKYTALTIFLDSMTQKKVQDEKGEIMLVDSQHTSHFELGQIRANSEATVIHVAPCYGGSKVVFSDGIIWRYKGFKFIIS